MNNQLYVFIYLSPLEPPPTQHIIFLNDRVRFFLEGVGVRARRLNKLYLKLGEFAQTQPAKLKIS